MSSINIVILNGYVGQEPQITSLENNIKVANFSLATSHPYKNKNGEKIDQTFWHRIVAFRGLAELAEKYIKKGALIGIQGQLRSRTYEKDGLKHIIVEVYAEQIQLLGSKSESNSNSNGNNNETKAQQQVATVQDFSYSPVPDDLPF